MSERIGYLMLVYALPIELCLTLFGLFFVATWYAVVICDAFEFIKSARRRRFVEYGISFIVAAIFLLPIIQLFRILGWLQ